MVKGKPTPRKPKNSTKTKSRKKKPKRSTPKLTSPCRRSKSLDIRIFANSHGDGSLYRIVRSPIKKDSSGESYIPFCTFRWHQGLILKGEKYCIERECKYYRLAYLSKPDFPS